MKILHVSAECYPMAKVGGLADVVGALPKYQNHLGQTAAVIMPMHRTQFLLTNKWDSVYSSYIKIDGQSLAYNIIQANNSSLGFDLFCVDIFSLLDREKVYGYEDDAYRFIAFQLSVLDWLMERKYHPDVIHVHDHHAAMIPFFIKHCKEFSILSAIKTVLTIHNAQYQGTQELSFSHYLPKWDQKKSGLLEWNDQFNPLACGIKCSDKVTTVSTTYLQELFQSANGIESLMVAEKNKCCGIINGIDDDAWNPETDIFLHQKYSTENVEIGKKINKQKICEAFNWNKELPLFIFIGRLVYEKAADLIPPALNTLFETSEQKFNFLLLGNGDNQLEQIFSSFNQQWLGCYHSTIQYNEALSHQMYAGADFLLMPSRIEPCGLNQLYAMRYGTIPIVRRTGGLNDTVVDMGDGGWGICFNQPSSEDIIHAMKRALAVYQEPNIMLQFSQKMMTINNSWKRSARKYIELYQSI